MNLQALHKVSYGLYVVCSKKDGKFNGQIANTIFQVCSEPPIIASALNKQNLTNEFVSASKVFSVSILSQDTPLSFIGSFGFKSGRDVDKFKGVGYKIGETGVPIVLDNAVAYLEAKVLNQMDVSTHTIFAAEIVAADVIREGELMTYAYYQQVKRGTTPKTAPTYIEEKKEATTKMSKYKCQVCGYIYNPDLGDPDGHVKPGTPWEKLPDDWVCPVCGATKDKFDKLD
jgi:flavin reductase (DIM6/NTAB) family NADH-FMN oxidoreductase RutF/rubredoxin